MNIVYEQGIYRIYEDKQIGSVEYYNGFIENIYLDPSYRGKGYLRKIIEYFPKPIELLPLPEHVEKFKHLGFKKHKQIREDVYYILNTQ